MNKNTTKTLKLTKNDKKKAATPVIKTPVREKILTFARLAVLFIISFCVVGIASLSIHLYGKRVQGVLQRGLSLFTAKKTVVKTTNSFADSVYFDPLDLVQTIKRGDTGIVFMDVRSSEEYKKEHVKGALSFPLYRIENGQMYYFETQDIVQKMRIDTAKKIVVYGPSGSFQKQQQIVDLLKKKGYAVKQLAIGWNELRHFQNIWIPEPLWGTIDVNSFIDTN